MDDFWLCTQCRASNRPAAAQCISCGLRRHPADPARSPARLIAGFLVVVVALTVGGTAGLLVIDVLPGASQAQPGAPSLPAVTAERTPGAIAISPPSPAATSRPVVPPTPSITQRPAATPRPAPTTRPSAAPSDEPVAPRPRSGPCADDAYNLLDRVRWRGPLEWRFNESSTPSEYDPAEVLDVIARSFDNVTEARNDCGLPDRIGATATYLGTGDQDVCGDASDGHNVVTFGSMPADVHPDTIAVTCWYSVGRRIVEADILISWDQPWALSPEACRGDEQMLEATMTHEVGHAFGLDHVGQRRHAHLTMSPKSGPCDNAAATLGLGDLRGLEELYGTD